MTTFIKQLNFFSQFDTDIDIDNAEFLNDDRSGSFVDNMSLPIHRWFRFSAGFSAAWVESVLKTAGKSEFTVLDPFAGSGTTLLSADKLGIKSFGIEAHPFLAKISKTKLMWGASLSDFQDRAYSILKLSKTLTDLENLSIPPLISKCFTHTSILRLYSLREAWKILDDGTNASQLSWLILTSILRSASTAGTAQWQYVLPNKKKKHITDPIEAYEAQLQLMLMDMNNLQQTTKPSQAELIRGDARNAPAIPDHSVDMVITSPPYANNYDYADATRLEMTFWGEISSWGDLHDAVRSKLIVSSSQHASKEKLDLKEILQYQTLDPIRGEITSICNELATVRTSHGGKKHYHTMIAAYFADLSLVFKELRRICKPNSKLCFVIGDSAPYGIYVPVDKWLGQLALYHGFSNYNFEKIRDRNIKWKNRKHRVPLKEGRLWIGG